MSAIKQIVPAVATMEGAGFTVQRSLGSPALKNLDPFLLLDHFSSDNPDDYIAGFPDHPHRGFITFTYMLNGNMQHRDSMGNEGNLQAGGAQWMKAGSGVIHSEMPKQVEGLLRGFQLWINLPASEKMTAPAYQEYSSGAFPLVKQDGAGVKVLMGSYQEQHAPISDPHTQVQYLDIYLEKAASFHFDMNVNRQGFLYVYEGEIETAGTYVAGHNLVVLAGDEGMDLHAGEKGARLILVTGKPLAEPIIQSGPFVMNSREEIQQCFDDYREGRLVRDRASTTSD